MKEYCEKKKSFIMNQGVLLKKRWSLWYSSETWALTERMKGVLRASDRRMLRYIAGVRWQDGLSSEQVARRCGVEELEMKFGRGILSWLGHVMRAGEGVKMIQNSLEEGLLEDQR